MIPNANNPFVYFTISIARFVIFFTKSIACGRQIVTTHQHTQCLGGGGTISMLTTRVKTIITAILPIYGMHGIHTPCTIILIFVSTKLISFVGHILKLYNLMLTFFFMLFSRVQGYN